MTLNEIYSQVPKIQCKGLCVKACGPVCGSLAEERKILENHGSLPMPMPNLQCDKLKDGRCTIYVDRPLICRLFGVVKAMRCPHGCTPETFLSERKARDLLAAAEKAHV